MLTFSTICFSRPPCLRWGGGGSTPCNLSVASTPREVCLLQQAVHRSVSPQTHMFLRHFVRGKGPGQGGGFLAAIIDGYLIIMQKKREQGGTVLLVIPTSVAYEFMALLQAHPFQTLPYGNTQDDNAPWGDFPSRFLQKVCLKGNAQIENGGFGKVSSRSFHRRDAQSSCSLPVIEITRFCISS